MILRRKNQIVLRDLVISCYSRSFIELIMWPERDLKSGNMLISKCNKIGIISKYNGNMPIIK